MESKTVDIRKELESRMAEIQGEIGTLREERDKIDKKLQEKDARLSALRVVYGIEAERLGVSKAPLFTGKGAPSRFAGMKLTDALVVIRKEKPEINKRQALKILEGEGFDFRGKRPLPAVHFAWVAIGRRKKVR